MPKILKTEESLMNYAAWYAMRYMPSFRKLEEALQKKTEGNTHLVGAVLSRMKEYISEERTIDGLVRMYIDNGKPRSYIVNKLREKKFDDEVMERILLEYNDSFSSYKNYEYIIQKKIKDLISLKKSRRAINMVLVQKYPLFKSEITETLVLLCSDETESIRYEIEKLLKKHDTSDRKERDKLMQKICNKGFSYDKVRKVMEEVL